MSLDKIQEDVDKWAEQFKKPYFNIEWMLARLIEEIGELAREINHLYGPKQKKSDEAYRNLGNELADVLFTVSCMANREGINLQKAWDKMIEEKNYGRDNNRYERKDGDTRNL